MHRRASSALVLDLFSRLARLRAYQGLPRYTAVLQRLARIEEEEVNTADEEAVVRRVQKVFEEDNADGREPASVAIATSLVPGAGTDQSSPPHSASRGAEGRVAARLRQAGACLLTNVCPSLPVWAHIGATTPAGTSLLLTPHITNRPTSIPADSCRTKMLHSCHDGLL